MLFRQKWRKRDTACLLLPCNGDFSCTVLCDNFYSSVIKLLVEVFSYCSVTQTFATGSQKTFENGRFHSVAFWLECATFHQLQVCMNKNLQELLKFDCLWTTSIFFDC